MRRAMNSEYVLALLWVGFFAVLGLIGFVWWIIERVTEDPLKAVNRHSKKDKTKNNLPPYMRGPF